MNKNLTAQELFDYMEGEWNLTRKIDGSHSAVVKGIACFKKMVRQNELHYSEDVETVLINGLRLKGYQNYIFRLENNLLNVYFKDGERLFHSIDTHHALPATHICQLDTYKTSYFFKNDYFQIEHQVNGPQKNYISQSLYTRYQLPQS
jgi:Family of unknown function (DUF6314)